MTTLCGVTKCNFCGRIIKFSADESDVFYFDLCNDDYVEKLFHKCEKCGKENYFKLSLMQVKEIILGGKNESD